MQCPRLRWIARTAAGVAVVVAVGAVLAAGLVSHRQGTDAEAALPVTRTLDRPAPDIAGMTVQGKQFDLAGLRGKVVVINVMASWCAPCRAELPELVAAAQRYSDSGVRLVGLAMRDRPGDTALLLQQAGAQDLPVLADPDGTRAVSLGVSGVPETFLVDRSGSLRLHAFGPVTSGWLDRQLAAMDAPP